MASPLDPNTPYAQALAQAEAAHRAGDLAGALKGYLHLAEQFPQDSESLFRAGLVRAQEGSFEEALDLLRRAARLGEKPHHLFALGDICERTGRLDEAIKAWHHAVALNPQLAAGHSRLGVVLADVGRAEEAAESFGKAAALSPNDAATWWNLGSTRLRLGQPERARTALQRAAQLAPDRAHIQEALGTALLRSGQLVLAREAFRLATDLSPARRSAWLGLANCDTHFGRTPEVLKTLTRAEALGGPDAAQIGSQRLIAMQYAAETRLEDIFQAHCEWGRRYAPTRKKKSSANTRDPDRRLRIGYISPRFHQASVSFLSAPVLESHDKKHFDVFCYAEQTIEDDLTRRVRAACAAWRSTVGLPDDAVATLIREDRIDILIDLAGHTPGHRLPVLALRPAPLQGTWLDYFNTTGVEAVDFILSDAVHSPPDDAQRFVEQVLWLPTLRYSWEPPAYAPTLEAVSQDINTVPTFGSFNRLAKISTATRDAWSALLTKLPTARLILKNSALAGPSERAEVAGWFSSRGIDPGRLSFRCATDHVSMLREYKDVDVVLDTFPYNGGLTTLEALWMGRPVVALHGASIIARQSEAILSAAGLSQLCAKDVDGYVELARSLALDRQGLHTLSASLRSRIKESSIVDVAGFTRSLEAVLRQAWRRSCFAGRLDLRQGH